jgi:hypothetical protein
MAETTLNGPGQGRPVMVRRSRGRLAQPASGGRRWAPVSLGAVAAALLLIGLHYAPGGSATITLNAANTYQTITGWEAVAEVGQSECTGYANYADEVFDLAANDLGINRLRLPLPTGTENTVDYFHLYITGQLPRSEWAAHRYESINDNANPNVIDPSRFQFAFLDHRVDHVVLPLKQALEARGESLYINLNLVDDEDGGDDSNVFYDVNPAEYAELVLATYQHLQSKYGWVPDAWEVVLEPDYFTPWNGTEVGNAIVAAGARLEANGFTPRFIAPSTTNMASAVTYFDQLVQVNGVLPYLSEISYHRYSGVSDQNLQAIANRAVQYGLDTAMLEHIGSGHEDLHQDLKLGRNSAWQQFTLAFCSANDNGGAYYQIDTSNPSQPVVSMGVRTKFLRQYFKFVRRGAVRIGATSDNAAFDPLAFVNTGNKYVVVVKANASGSIQIGGLPAGTYGIKYTTNSQYDVNRADVTIAAGQQVTANIPAAGVITIYAKGQVTPTATAPFRLSLPLVTASPSSRRYR